MPIEETGVRAIVDGVAQYQQDAARINAATQSMVDRADSAAKQARAVAERQGQALQAMGQRMREVGQQAVFLGAALSAPGLLSVGFAARFEQDFAGVRKTVDGTTAQLVELRAELLNLSRTIPTSPGGLAAIAENAGALGVAREDIIEFTRVTAQLAATTNLTADAASTSLAQFANILQIPLAEIDRVGAALVDLGNNGASTEAQILDFALRLAGAGKVIGLSASEVLGFSNALASLGINAEAGGTAFSRVFVEIAKAVQIGGDSLQQFADVAGVSSAEFAKNFEQDSAGAIISFVEGLGRITAAGGRTFQTLEDLSLGDNRLRDALLRASGGGDILRASIDRGGQAFRENTALVVEFGKRAETASSQVQLLRNDVQRLAIRAGDSLLPALKGATAVARSFVEGLSSLPEPVLGAVAGLSLLVGGAAAAAASAAVLGGTMLVLNGALVQFTGIGAAAAFTVLARSILQATAALGAFAVSPAGLAILGIAAATAGAIAAYRHFTAETAVVEAAQARLAEANNKQAEAMRNLASATRELRDLQAGEPESQSDQKRTRELDAQTASVENLTKQYEALIKARGELSAAQAARLGREVIPVATAEDRTPTAFGQRTLNEAVALQEGAGGRGFRRADISSEQERANFDFAASILGLEDPLGRIDPLVLKMTRSLSENEKILLRDAAAARIATIAQRELVQAQVARSNSAAELSPDESAGREARAISQIASARDRLRNSMDAQKLALSSIVRGSEIEREAETRLKDALAQLQRVREQGRATPPATVDVEAERRAVEEATTARETLSDARQADVRVDVQTGPLEAEQAAAETTRGAYEDLQAVRGASPERADQTGVLGDEEAALARVAAAEARLSRIRSGAAAPEGQTDGLATEEQAIAELEAAYAALNAIRATAPEPPVPGFGDEQDALRALEDAYGRIDDVRLAPATPGTPDFTAEEQAIADVAGQYGALDERRSTAADPGVPDFTPEEQAIAALEGRYADLDRVRQPEGQAQPAPDFTAEEAAVAAVEGAYGDLDAARGVVTQPSVPDLSGETAAVRDVEGAYRDLDVVRREGAGTPEVPSFAGERDALAGVEYAYGELDERRREVATPGVPDFGPEREALTGVEAAYGDLDAVRQQPVDPAVPDFTAEREAVADVQQVYGDLDARRARAEQPAVPDFTPEVDAIAGVVEGAYGDLDAVRAARPEVAAPDFGPERDAILAVESDYDTLNRARAVTAAPEAQTAGLDAETAAIERVQRAQEELDALRTAPDRSTLHTESLTAEAGAVARLVAAQLDLQRIRVGGGERDRSGVLDVERESAERDRAVLDELAAARGRTDTNVDRTDPLVRETAAAEGTTGAYDALNVAREAMPPGSEQSVALDEERQAAERAHSAQEALDAVRGGTGTPEAQTAPLDAEAAAAGIAREALVRLDEVRGDVTPAPEQTAPLDAEAEAADAARVARQDLDAVRRAPSEAADHTADLAAERRDVAELSGEYEALAATRGEPVPENQSEAQLEAQRRAVEGVRLAEEELNRIRERQTRPDITASIEAERVAINEVREAAEALAAVYGAGSRTVGQVKFFDDRQLGLLVFASEEAGAALKALETIQNSSSASAEERARAEERLAGAISAQQRAATRISASAGVVDAAREIGEAQRALQLIQRSGSKDAAALAEAQNRVTAAYEEYARVSRSVQTLTKQDADGIDRVKRAREELSRLQSSGTASTDELREATDRLNDAFDEMANSPVALIIDGIASSTDALSRSLDDATAKMKALARAQIDEAASRRRTIPEVFRNLGPEQEAAGFGAAEDFPRLGQTSSSLTPEERLRLTQEQAAADRQAQNEALQAQLRATTEAERAAAEAERAYRESIEGRTAEIVKRSQETRSRALAEAAIREAVGVEGDSVGQLQEDFRRADAIFAQMRTRLQDLGVEIPESVRDMIDQTVATARQKSKTAGEQLGGILGFLLARRLGMGQDPGAGLIRVPAAQQAALAGGGQQQVINFNGPISYGAGVTTGDVQQGTSVALRMALSQQ